MIDEGKKSPVLSSSCYDVDVFSTHLRIEYRTRVLQLFKVFERRKAV